MPRARASHVRSPRSASPARAHASGCRSSPGWRERTDMTVNVGLGFNNKQQQLALLVQLISMQKEAIAAGLSSPEKVYNALDKMVNAAGLGDVKQYFIDPKGPEYQPPQPPPPPPEAALAQAQAQALGQEQQRKGQELQQKGQLDAAKLQAEQQDKQRKFELEQADKQLESKRLDAQIARDNREQAQAEAKLPHEIDNIEADTTLKLAQAGESRVKASATAVESSEAYKGAKEIVENEGNEFADADDDDEGNDDAGNTET